MINAKEDATPLINPGEYLARILRRNQQKTATKERRNEDVIRCNNNNTKERI